MYYASVGDMIRESAHAVQIDGEVRVTDPTAFRHDVIDRLVYTAVFGSGETQEAARWLIWEAAWDLGVRSASIDDLYQARARGEFEGLSVPAINVRGMSYDTARAATRAAVRRNVGAYIFELARSEMGYTFQRPAEFVSVITAAAIKEGHQGPLFIQGDHYQANAKKYVKSPDAEIQGLRDLITEAIAAGYQNIDIDTSTLVDLSYPTVMEQQRHNYERCAELAALIRELEPEGVTISIGGEIGEVGKHNSTVEELRAFLDGFNQVFRRLAGDARGLSKVSVQTGSSHGGVVLPDGSIAQVKIDFETLRSLSAVAREYGLGGAVQHGASTLPAALFDRFPEAGCLEIHLATEFQNISFDGGAFPGDLKEEIYAFLRKEMADEKVDSETDQQFIYKTRKKAWGPFKQQVWDISPQVRGEIGGHLEAKFEFLYSQLGVIDSRAIVERYVTPVRVTRPAPASLQAASPR